MLTHLFYVLGIDGYVWVIDQWGKRNFGVFEIVIGVSKMCNTTRVPLDNDSDSYILNEECFNIYDNMPSK